MREAQKGDAVAYESFLNLVYPYVRGIVRSRVGNWLDIDDITQECLLGMHKSLATYHPSKSVKPWLHAIVRYKLIDYFRAHARQREVVTSPEIIERTGREEDEVGSEESSEVDVYRLLEKLPEPLRRAVMLTRLDGLSTEEAAKKEGIRPAALRKRVSRAYLQMSRMLDHQFRQEGIHGE